MSECADIRRALVLDSPDLSPPTRYELYRNALIDLLQSKRKNPPLLEVKMDTDGRVCVEGGLVVDVADAKELGQSFSEVRVARGLRGVCVCVCVCVCWGGYHVY